MKMKKLIAATAAAALAVSLTACGVDISQANLPDNVVVAPGEKVEMLVTFVAENPDVAIEDLEKAASKLGLAWETSDESIATVDKNGVVTGVAVGEADITVTSKDGKVSDSTTVVVAEPVTEIQSDDINMVVGDKDVEIVYTLLPETAKADEIQFIIDEVDEGAEPIVKVVDGKLEALAAGETNITIKVGDVTKVIKVVVAETETPETPEKPEKTPGKAPDKAPEKDKSKTPVKDTSPTKKPTDKNDKPTSGTASGNGNNGGNNKPVEKPVEKPVNPAPEKPVTPPAPPAPAPAPAPEKPAPTTPPAPPAPVEPAPVPPAPAPTTPPAPPAPPAPAPAPDNSMDNDHVIEDNPNEQGNMDGSIHVERP